jgi:hypothetical protein
MRRQLGKGIEDRFTKIAKNEDGHLVGDCELCIIKLVYGCTGLLAVRNHLGLLEKTLDELAMVVQSKNLGDETSTRGRIRGLLGAGVRKYRNSSIPPPKADKSQYFNQKELKGHHGSG